MPELSYVIPVYNKVEITYNFCVRAMRSIEEHTKEMSYEVVVIDNRSPYHEELPVRQVREMFGNAKVISLPQNVGFGQACNMGFEFARGEWLVCMNSDAALVEDSPALLRYIMEKENLKVGFPEHYEACQQYKLTKDERLMLDWYFGAFWMAKRDFIVNEMGGFDPHFEMCYYEDTDLWSRIMKKGYNIAGWRNTWVKHHGNASALPTLSELMLKNRQRYIDRWGTDKVVRPVLTTS